MIFGPWTGITIVLAVFGLLFGALKLAEKALKPHPELLRKLFHVGMGLVVISFPWVFAQQWPVLLLAALSLALLLVVRCLPSLHDGIGSVLFSVRRISLGEICFPVAVGSLALLSGGDKLLFVVPMLIMTLADAVAALIGVAYGKVRYITSEGLKSVEGSIAFFTIAFFSIHVPLLLFTNVGRPQTLLIACIISLLSMLIEATAWRGLDNLFIPMGAFAFLKLYLDATPSLLLMRLGATLLLLAFALVWRRRSSLDDSALMGCALFGYAALMVGGSIWLIGPVALFLVHVALWPRHGQTRQHHSYAVLSVTSAGLFWLGVHVARGGHLFPYAVGFGSHLAIIGVSRIAIDRRPGRSDVTRLSASIIAGWLLSMMQMMPTSIEGSPIITAAGWALALCGIAVAAIGFYVLLPWLYGPRGSDIAIHTTGAILGFAGSLAVLGAG